MYNQALGVLLRACVVFDGVVVERLLFNHGFAVFTTDLVGNLTQLVMVGNVIFKLSPCAERYTIYDDMIV